MAWQSTKSKEATEDRLLATLFVSLYCNVTEYGPAPALDTSGVEQEADEAVGADRVA